MDVVEQEKHFVYKVFFQMLTHQLPVWCKQYVYISLTSSPVWLYSEEVV